MKMRVAAIFLGVGMLFAQSGLVSRKTAEHYVWGGDCDGWYLLKTDAMHVIEERLPPGRGESLHLHRKALQSFYVLKGTATFEADGKTVTVGERESFVVQPGTKHRVTNHGRGDLEILVTSQPPSHGDREEVAR